MPPHLTIPGRPSCGGFTLTEALIVLMVMGLMAAIAIPNFGPINSSAKDMVAQRNAMAVASVLNAATSAGADLGFSSDITSATAASAIVDLAETGVTPMSGSFAGKRFSSGEIDDGEEGRTAALLRYDHDNKVVTLLNAD